MKVFQKVIELHKNNPEEAVGYINSLIDFLTEMGVERLKAMITHYMRYADVPDYVKDYFKNEKFGYKLTTDNGERFGQLEVDTCIQNPKENSEYQKQFYIHVNIVSSFCMVEGGEDEKEMTRFMDIDMEDFIADAKSLFPEMNKDEH